MSYISQKKSCDLKSLSINEMLLDENKIKLKNMNDIKVKKWYDFGFECVVNCRNDVIIMVIGGGYRMRRDIHLFNCTTNELTCKDQVL